MVFAVVEAYLSEEELLALYCFYYSSLKLFDDIDVD